MDKYKNKYRIPSTRLPYWDYSSPGAYFITICTKHKSHYFGTIQNEKSILSPIGVIADILWYEIKNHAQNVALGEFVVMPNHVHGMLILTGDENSDTDLDSDADSNARVNNINMPAMPIGEYRFQNQGKNSVSSIIGGYKSAVSKHARRLGYEFGWQASFWDHVVRTDGGFDRISNYIKNNPAKWDLDKFNGGTGNVVLEPNVDYGAEAWMV